MANSFIGNYSYNENGVLIPDTADIQATVQEEYRSTLGADLSVEESTPQGRLIDVETTARQNTIKFNALMANILINVNLASGATLDAWGANFNIPRNGATSSTVPVQVTGTPRTIIPADSQASTADGSIWQALNEIVIGSTGIAQGVFYSVQTGQIQLAEGQLTNIVASTTTGIVGWETITNTANATVGQEKESDYDYRNRILEGIFTGTALFGNYASAAYRVEGVQNIYAYDNPFGTSLQLDNITIPPHSVYVAVEGGNNEDVAYSLYEVKSAGAGWAGNTTIVVTDKTFGTQNTVKYQIPTQLPFVINVDATSVLNSNQDLTATIKNVILNYTTGMYSNDGFPKPGIRSVISPFTIASLLNQEITGINVSQVEIGLETPTPHAVADIIKASVTSGLTWASVVSSTFATQVTANGTYNFVYDGTNWQLNGNNVTLSDYGITITTVNENELITGDVVTVVYSDGQLSSSVIKIFASEFPTFSADNITVNINV